MFCILPSPLLKAEIEGSLARNRILYQPLPRLDGEGTCGPGELVSEHKGADLDADPGHCIVAIALLRANLLKQLSSFSRLQEHYRLKTKESVCHVGFGFDEQR